MFIRKKCSTTSFFAKVQLTTGFEDRFYQFSEIIQGGPKNWHTLFCIF